MEEKELNRTKCRVYSRVVGYIRPVDAWNVGKQEEYKDRKLFKVGYDDIKLDGEQK
jgi:ribonucleoside-triphosphate reductase (formate)